MHNEEINENNDYSLTKEEKKELLITTFLGVFGIHRMIHKEYITGVIYFFTAGLLFFGWIYDIIMCLYFYSENFKKIKERIKNNTDKFNELNHHIEELKNTYADIKQIDYGTANFNDTSKWNYRRPYLRKYTLSQNVYNCSRTIVGNAKNQPFKYICKYFNIKPTEDNLEKFEKVLNDFSAAEQGKYLLKNERDSIIATIWKDIPLIYRILNKNKTIKELGFEDIDFSQLYFPKYTFDYISSGGYSGMKCTIILNINNLNRFISYLSEIIKFKKSAAGQRALMTSDLREKIKKRDNYTCQQCNNSIEKEPNLLLEIDHIVPIAKGGMTTEENLQTLCWKCNRHKGAK